MNKNYHFLVLVGLLAFGLNKLQAQENPDILVLESDVNVLPSLSEAVSRSLSPSYSQFFSVPNKMSWREIKDEAFDRSGPDPALREQAPNLFLSGSVNIVQDFAGTGNVSGVAPPDTHGDVGPNHYVQMINSVTTIFNKAGGVVTGPFNGNVFFAGMGNVCETTNRGDPYVLYDEAADRWLVSQFAFTSTTAAPWLQCVAVSQTGDPNGAYNQYSFVFDSIGFNDYPKHGITTNSISTYAHIFNAGFLGTFQGVADKAAMYAGNPATMLGCPLDPIPGDDTTYSTGDLDDPTGIADPVNALFVKGDVGNGNFTVRELVPNFATGALTCNDIVVTGGTGFDWDAGDADQPGTANNLDTLPFFMMNRAQIKDYGAFQSIVTSITADAGGDRPAVRWAELRKPDGGNWTFYQEGTHTVADGDDRWMSSIAANDAGFIGLGYSQSGPVTFPTVTVTCQTPTERATASGVMDVTEQICEAGAGFQSNPSRWGDYSALNVDSSTDNFWFTTEYVTTGGNFAWNTRVCEFFCIDDNLPVELIDFGAEMQGDQLILNWSTASESNNSGFNIEYRPVNTEQWENIAFIDGAGTVEGQQDYSYVVNDLEPNNYLFRLRQTDFDGTINHSQNIEVIIGVPDTHFISEVYPNPFNSKASIRVAVPEMQNLKVELFDGQGQKVSVLFSGLVEADEQRQFTVVGEDFPSGLYFIQVSGDNFTDTKSVMLIK